MLKMFTTQLTGLFKKIAEEEEFSLEDGARLLAQAPAGDGAIYLYGTHEMKAVLAEATEGAEPLRSAKILPDPAALTGLTEADRVLMITRYATDAAAVECANRLKQQGIPFVGMSSVQAEKDGEDLSELADVHINLQLTKGLLPDEDGSRFALPFSMAALFAYYALSFTINEILAEYE